MSTFLVPQIYIMNADGSRLSRVTNDPGFQRCRSGLDRPEAPLAERSWGRRDVALAPNALRNEIFPSA